MLFRWTSRAKRREALCRAYMGLPGFASASPPSLGWSTGSSGERPRLDLVTIAFNNPMVIEQQIRLIRKYVRDSFCHSVVDNSPDPEHQGRIRAVCAGVGVPYLLLPPNPFSGADPSFSHGLALNFVYEKYVKPRGLPFFGFLDHDIFPVAPTRITEALEVAPMFGVLHRRPPRWYLWPGFSFFRSEYLRGKAVDFRPGDGCDTGGGNWESLYSSFPITALPPLHVQIRNLRDGNDKQADLYEKIGAWVHTFNASRWKDVPDKDGLVRAFLGQF